MNHRYLPGLPTARDDWRLMGTTARLVLAGPRYGLLAVVTALAGLSLFVLSLNLPLVFDVVLGGSLPVDRRLAILLNLYPVASATAFGPGESAVLLATAGLIGVNVSLATYHLLEQLGDARAGTGSAAGVVLGTLGAGCAACGSAVLAGLLSLFGVAGGLAVLPLEGLEFAVAALVVLVLSWYWLADGMRGGMVRGCPVEP